MWLKHPPGRCGMVDWGGVGWEGGKSWGDRDAVGLKVAMNRANEVRGRGKTVAAVVVVLVKAV